MTYFAYGVLLFVGHMRDFFRKLTNWCSGNEKVVNEGYAPLLQDFEDFYTRRLYKRIEDCWNRPIDSCPGAWINVLLRSRDTQKHPFELNGESKECLNLGSYNYLGFGDPDSPTKPHVFEALDEFGITTTSSRMSTGTTSLHADLEKLVARFLRKDAAMVFGMGFGTNSTGIPALIGKGGLIISDSNNHSSIVAGARSSGAHIKVFQHNDAANLEAVVRRAIVEGQPRTHRPWTKILIMIEGIYSMEGELSPLASIVAVKKKYGCYLYVDEAHSIGALGKTGQGICQHAGVDPADVDILMGTFTKSFGAVGGYIASSREIVNHLRLSSMGSVYSASISPPACMQIIQAIKIIIGEDGTNLGQTKLTTLKTNANYFRQRMKSMGCHVLGDQDSPIVPMMLYKPAKIPAFSRECLERNLAVVVVGFPATPLLLARTRFCISAAHTRKDLEDALDKIEEVCDILGLKYGTAMCTD
eukprot:CAMPEP_0175144046 /NCGR_PEP_ID=MMETSP0087-20121206/13868_1 /TAXON_ID=136419 /ORGANISM="Unknown Unknown, Strain D1" /LENGTH=471 /DNA_ID=CAMNT_0016428379 /DNA_START=82 /DNA_END=1497 /DNA_ORIENTATION=-